MKYRIISRPEDLREIYRRMKSLPMLPIAFDTETYGPLTDWVKQKKGRYVWELTAKIAGFSFAFENEAYYIPLDHSDKENNYPLEDFKGFAKKFFALPNRIWGHNLDYDFRIIRNVMGEYLTPKLFGDTMVLAWLADKGMVRWKQGKPVSFYGLKDLVEKHFGHSMVRYEDLFADYKVLESGPTDKEIDSALDDFLLDIRSNGKKPVGAPRTPRELQRLSKRRKELEKKRVYREPQMNDMPSSHVAEYACEDAYWTLKLAIRFFPFILETGYKDVWDLIDMPRLMVIRRMHDNGVPVSVEEANKVKQECDDKCLPLEKRFFELTGLNIRSTPQIAELIEKRLSEYPEPLNHHASLSRGKTGELSIDQDNLARIKNLAKHDSFLQEVIDIKIQYAVFNKIGSTYTKSLLVHLPYAPDGRAHPRFKMTNTRTGRLSSAEPNAQNFPRPGKDIPNVRAIVKAPPGMVLASIDFSQIEIIIMAVLSKDSALTDIILSGKSMHDVTAANLGIDRSTAKTVNFLKNYGGGAKKLAIGLNIPLEDGKAPRHVQEYCDRYDELYSGVTQFRDDMSDFAYKNGFVQTLFGRRRYVPEVKRCTDILEVLDRKWQRGLWQKKNGNWNETDERKFQEVSAERRKNRLQLWHAQRICSNTPIQGTAACIMDKAMVDVDAYLQLPENAGGQMIMQVHDELVFLFPEKRAEIMLADITKIMEDAVKLDLPIKAEGKLGLRWSDCK